MACGIAIEGRVNERLRGTSNRGKFKPSPQKMLWLQNTPRSLLEEAKIVYQCGCTSDLNPPSTESFQNLFTDNHFKRMTTRINTMLSRPLASAFSVSVILHALALSLFGRESLISPAHVMPPLTVILTPAPSAPSPPVLTDSPLTPVAQPTPTRPPLSGVARSSQSTTHAPTRTPDVTLFAAPSEPSLLSLPTGSQQLQACRPQAIISPEVIKLVWEAYARGYGWANPPVPPTSTEERSAPAQTGC